VAEIDRYVEIVNALHHVPYKPARLFLYFDDALHARSLKHESPRHDKAYVSRTDNNYFFTGQEPFNVNQFLR